MSASDSDRARREELWALRDTLSRPLPELDARYFYDDRGSALFEQITELEEYYQTRTELSILADRAEEIMRDAAAVSLVELRSGAGRKIRLLLDAWSQRDDGGRCVMLDVNESFLAASVRTLGERYPRCAFEGVVGDFSKDLRRVLAPSPCMTVFFAGTVGNLYPDARRAFFATLAASMGTSDSFLVGVDLVKDRARLERAYNDDAGVTADFNKNALRVVNQRFGADFDEGAFEHRAFYDDERQWIEMRLRATRASVASIPEIEWRRRFAVGDEIRTEISCKFTRMSLELALAEAGLLVRAWHADREGLFALAHCWKRA
jgi:L-histidine N-alpha-methyltransferase